MFGQVVDFWLYTNFCMEDQEAIINRMDNRNPRYDAFFICNIFCGIMDLFTTPAIGSRAFKPSKNLVKT